MQRDNNIPKGYKLSPLGPIPSDWDLKELEQLGSFSKGKGILKEQVVSDGYPCVRYGEIYTTHDFIIKEFKSFITEDVAKDSQKIRKGDVLFAGSGETIEEIGKSVAYVGNEKAYAGGDVIILSTNNNVNAECLSYALETDFVRKQKRMRGQGQQVVHIYPSDLAKVKVLLPPLKEQTAIANLLSTWDKAINTLTQLIAQKELRKKWLMQQLLTGKKRLKGFKAKWKEVKLSDLFDRVTRKNNEANTNVVTISAQRGFIRQDDYFNKTVASEITDNYFLVERGEFCYNKSYSNGYPWGATKRLNDFDKAVVTTLYICFGIKDEAETSGDFFEQYFESGSLEKGLMKIAHEGGRAHGLLNVTPSDFFDLKISVPDFDEQTAIANVLQSADAELSLLRQKLDKLKEQKKGLMQVLLTGKKRLNY
ncbi:MAG: restriction endonuclease subunit S [Cyclobacteriaceae bacterium]